MMTDFTTQDIADHLKVSRRTVSSVLNGKAEERRISKKTVKRVNDYVEKIGFYRNIGALSIKGMHSVDVAFVIYSNLYFEQQAIYFRLIEFLDKSNLTYITLHFPDENYSRFCQELKANNPKKVVVFAYFFFKEYLLENWTKIRNNYLADVPCYYHYVQDYSSIKNLLTPHDSVSYLVNGNHTRRAIELLKSRGYKKIFVLDYLIGLHLDEEFTAKMGDIEIVPFRLTKEILDKDVFYVDKLIEMGGHIAKEILKHKMIPGKTAMVIHNEYQSMACVNYLRKMKIRIPEDILPVSGEIMPETRYYDYPRLYWEYPFEQMYLALQDWISDENIRQELIELKIKLKNKELASAKD